MEGGLKRGLTLGLFLMLAACSGGGHFSPTVAGSSSHTVAALRPLCAGRSTPSPAPSACGRFSSSAAFDSTSMPAGSVLWLAAITGPDFGVHSPVTATIAASTVSFMADGKAYTIPVPSGTVTFDPNATSSSLTYGANGWVSTVGTGCGEEAGDSRAPRVKHRTERHGGGDDDCGDGFVTGVAVALPSGLPGSITNVAWSGVMTTNQPGGKFDFYWAASVYSQFPNDYNAAGIDVNGVPQSLRRSLLRGALEGVDTPQFHVYGCGSTPSPSPAPTSTPVALPSGSPPPSLPPPSSVTQYPCGTQMTSGIASGPDGALWFTGSSDVDRMTTAGVTSLYTTPTANAGVTSIAKGPDGALWFTEYTANQIGRITTAGQIAEYSIPTAGSGPESIANGPDGALWFTEYNASAIGRIAIDGTITQYPTLTPNAGPYGIAAGADGTLWFTENSAGRIGRISIAGLQNEYSIPSAGSAPMGIAVGPDSAMWFTENARNAIGHVTLAGIVTEYTSPSIGGPSGISVGADQAMWFTQTGGNALGRITTAGTISQYALPTANAQPGGIVYGPDGALWFTERGINEVGRIVP